MDETVIPQGGKWVINSDMDIIDGGDLWDVKLLCFMGGNLNNAEKPLVIVKKVNIATSVSTRITTDISANEYICGARNIAPTLLSVRTFPENGFWVVEGNIANRNKCEDFTVDIFCVKKGIAVEDMPPN